MSKLKPAVEALTLYTILHALSHILPLLAVTVGVTEHLTFHNHDHAHNHSHEGYLLTDTLILTGIMHLAIPFFTFYYTHSRNRLQSNFLLHGISFNHKVLNPYKKE